MFIKMTRSPRRTLIQMHLAFQNDHHRFFLFSYQVGSTVLLHVKTPGGAIAFPETKLRFLDGSLTSKLGNRSEFIEEELTPDNKGEVKN